MKISKLRQVLNKMMLAALFISVSLNVYSSGQVDSLAQAARDKVAQGDLEAATALYYEALKQDSENNEIRQALAKVLVEASTREPHTDSLEVIDVIEKGTETSVD